MAQDDPSAPLGNPTEARSDPPGDGNSPRLVPMGFLMSPLVWLTVAITEIAILYLALQLYKIFQLKTSDALAVLALVALNVGVGQGLGNMLKAQLRIKLGRSATIPGTGTSWRPGYSYLLAVGFFGLAIALYSPPPRAINSKVTIALMPSPLPRPSQQVNASPSPAPSPMQCDASLEGPDTLTPGGAAHYDVLVSCPQVPKSPTVVIAPAPWITPSPIYKAVPEDNGRTLSWRFLVDVPAPSGTVELGSSTHTMLISKITTQDGDQPNQNSDQQSPLLSVTIKQDRTLDSIKTIIVSASGALGALTSLIAGLLAFLKGSDALRPGDA